MQLLACVVAVLSGIQARDRDFRVTTQTDVFL